ncbi:hypothetical protein FKP32DRAFT_446423 [Trametes sanguinea]|nr:hypothetical protein FKP32DRAFT_446423 [Trametes sanguinea]
MDCSAPFGPGWPCYPVCERARVIIIRSYGLWRTAIVTAEDSLIIVMCRRTRRRQRRGSVTSSIPMPSCPVIATAGGLIYASGERRSLRHGFPPSTTTHYSAVHTSSFALSHCPMPPKDLVRERAWGTRYDTLESEPSSPPIRRRSAADLKAHSPISPVSNRGSQSGVQTSSPSGEGVAAQDASHQDASIFVGGLPTNIDYAELTQRLTDHLSIHPQVNAVKVVRNSGRSGVCAFIQCESLPAAGKLLQDLQSSPQRPFHGHFLRFEATKASHALLTSHQPAEDVLSGDTDDSFNRSTNPAVPSLESNSSTLADASSRWADQVSELDAFTKPLFATPFSSHRSSVATSHTPGDRAVSRNPSNTVDQHEAHRNVGQAGSQLSAVSPTAFPRNQGSPPSSITTSALGSGGVPWNESRTSPALRLPFDASTREVDPTTIFVGGLSMQDAEPWTEEKLRRIFGRFGPIERVQIVRPLYKRSCFAFLTFTHPEAASRAVQEENNRMYLGQPIRVHLREYHARWKPGRGRGRSLYERPREDPSRRQQSEQLVAASGVPDSASSIGTTAQSPPVARAASSMSSSGEASSAAGDIHSDAPHGLPHSALRRLDSEDLEDSAASSISSDTTKVAHTQYDSNGPSSTNATPPPHTATAPTPLSAVTQLPPAPMNLAHFNPHAWMYPYPPPSYPYGFPLVPGYHYAGYAYPPFAPLPAFIASEGPYPAVLQSSEGNSTIRADAPLGDRSKQDGSSNDLSGRLLPQSGTQPPLRATGFIQNEQGMFIPVYQQDALDQYMVNAHGGQPHPVRSTSPRHDRPPACAPSFAGHPNPFPILSGTHPTPPMQPHTSGLTSLAQHGYWIPGGPPPLPVRFAAQGTPSAPVRPTSGMNAAQGGAHHLGQIQATRGQPPPMRGGAFPPRRFGSRDRRFP